MSPPEVVSKAEPNKATPGPVTVTLRVIPGMEAAELNWVIPPERVMPPVAKLLLPLATSRTSFPAETVVRPV